MVADLAVVHCSQLLTVELACLHLAVHNPVVARLHAAHLHTAAATEHMLTRQDVEGTCDVIGMQR